VLVATTPTAAAETAAVDGGGDGGALGPEGAAPVPGPPAAAVNGGMAGRLRVGQRLLVQVLRDPVRGKGATLSTYVSLAGRLLVLMPSLGRPGVSRRIEDPAERTRLRESLAALKGGEGLGVIARTAAADERKAALQRDFDHLRKRWAGLEAAVAAAEGPGVVLSEDSAAVRAVRDLFSPAVTRILVDLPKTEHELRDFLTGYAPAATDALEIYAGTRPLFEALDVERACQSLVRSRVPVGSGATIVVHETEALTAIDVNSGRLDRGSLERTAFECNLLAADEIARQIRLRDLGGIVVVDFIDMQDAANRRELETRFRAALKDDRSRLKMGRMGAFGLLPLTRRRQGGGPPRVSELPCQACQGSGSAAAAHSGALRALRRLRALEGAWRLRAHPTVLEVLAEHHAKALAEITALLALEQIGDPQVACGDPVLERP